MSVPSHNLYDFIHQTLEKRYWLLYFFPWGSRDINHIVDHQTGIQHLDGPRGISSKDRFYKSVFKGPLEKINLHSLTKVFQPILLCHDQEPLNYDLYQDHNISEFLENQKNSNEIPYTRQNLRNVIIWSWRKKWILLHSELNSPELEKYEATGQFQGAYFWSHAFLALDWYRFAQYDRALYNRHETRRTFLIYSRDCTGTRAYRRVFLEKIQGFRDQCQIGSSVIPGPTASAEYDANDFCSTDISIVLETLFDDPRMHLTEKILRPIACGHPFILASGPDSLKLLKRYGFRSFDPWIDESYDTISDSSQRLEAIINSMKKIIDLSEDQRKEMIEYCREIALYNQKHFFSHSFRDLIVQELVHNVELAEKQCQELDWRFWWKVRQWRKKNRPDLINTDKFRADRRYLILLVRRLRKFT